MKLASKIVRLAAVAFSAALLLTGCTQDQAPTAPSVELKTQETPSAAQISLIDFLRQIYANLLQNRTVSVVVDSASGDTSFVFTWNVDGIAQARGIRPSAVAFHKSTVERMQNAWRSAYSSAYGKTSTSAQTRWKASDYDVKSLAEVHEIKVYFEVSGGSKMKPNWSAAAREAMTRWNAMPGTEVSFVETSSATDNDIRLRCALSGDGSGVMTWLTPDPWVEKDSVEIFYNLGYESTISQDMKITFAMVGFANVLNITHTGNEGGTWIGGGTFINIPGTPYSDAASVFQPAVGPGSPTTFSQNDIRAVNQLYPVWTALAKNTANELAGLAWESSTGIASNVSTFESEGDTLYFLRNDGSFWRKIGVNGANVQLWPTGSFSGALGSFAVSGGFVVVQKASNGMLYTRKPGQTSWSQQTGPYGSGFGQYRIAGEHLSVYYPNMYHVYSRYLVSNPGSWIFDWGSVYTQSLESFGNRQAVIEGGRLTIRDGNGSWSTIWDASDGGQVKRVMLSDSHIAILVDYGYGFYVGYTKPAYGGYWSGNGYPSNLADADLCGDKFAVINQAGAYGGDLYLTDLNSGDMFQHTGVGMGPALAKKVRLSGPMCDYVTLIDHENVTWSKYSVTNTPFYLYYFVNSTTLSQR